MEFHRRINTGRVTVWLSMRTLGDIKLSPSPCLSQSIGESCCTLQAKAAEMAPVESGCTVLYSPILRLIYDGLHTNPTAPERISSIDSLSIMVVYGVQKFCTKNHQFLAMLCSIWDCIIIVLMLYLSQKYDHSKAHLWWFCRFKDVVYLPGGVGKH